MPAVSVIIPNYNHAPYLEERIRSVLEQSFTDFELILLDDASTDNSRKILESFSNHSKVSQVKWNELNSGSPFSQWKKGVSLATGKWVWIAESDDIASPSFLAEAMKAFDQQPDAVLFYCDAFNIRKDNGPVSFLKYSECKKNIFETGHWELDYNEAGEKEINNFLKFICSINNTSSVVFRKDVLEKELNGTENFRFHGDWYYLLKVCSRGNLVYSAKTLNSFRMKADSLGKQKDAIRSKTEYFRILDWLLQQEFVNDKKKLTDFFILQYTGYGWLSDGARHGHRLFMNYKQINASLARKIYWRMIWLKISGKKRRTLF